jgi:hypothetical protein
MTGQLRLVAHVGPLPHAPRTRHTIVRGTAGADELMPPAQVLLLEVEASGAAQLYRYTLDGEFAGDTWHESRADAEHQVAYEYGAATSEWSPVPADVADATTYAIEWARRSRPEA